MGNEIYKNMHIHIVDDEKKNLDLKLLINEMEKEKLSKIKDINGAEKVKTRI